MKKRLNKKGFTLVELIIVIAILAILVAVLAPQYIKYVSKAEDGVVLSAANDMLSVAKTEAALGAFNGTGTITITGGKDGGITLATATYDATKGTFDKFEDMYGDDKGLTDLKKTKSTKSYVIDIDGTNKTAVKKGEWK